ncbi:MAG: SDR family NAD(P)-dependent oxidoreductase [Solirubrobacterales bacterium]
MNLRDASTVVTGASSGIGAETAKAFGKRGARVALLSRTRSKLEDVAEQVESAGGIATVHPCDVGDHEAVQAVADEILAERTPNVVVNNAGAGRFLFLEETDPEELEQMIRVPALGALFVTRAFLPAMVRRDSGVLVTLNTPAAYAPWPGSAGYATARWAMRGMTEALRADLHGTGLTVTQVIPGEVKSDYFDNNPGAADRLPGVSKLMPKLEPSEVGEAVASAVEDEAGDVFLPFTLRASALSARLTPRITSWVVARTGADRP